MTKKYDFANILFAGPCNQRCPYCIGQQVDPALKRNNLGEFPLRNQDVFVALLRQHCVRQIVLTGTTTDPQLYRHEARLIRWLREQVPEAQISLHTNGQLALAKIDVFNLYDRATVSFPSFDPGAFQKMTSTRRIIDLAAILRAARIPIKVSCVINEHNADQVDEFLARCHDIGVRRLVFRQLFGDTRRWDVLSSLTPVAFYRHNPVYDYHGMEVTYWHFHRTASTSLNLFSNGSISTEYLLTRHEPRPAFGEHYTPLPVVHISRRSLPGWSPVKFPESLPLALRVKGLSQMCDRLAFCFRLGGSYGTSDRAFNRQIQGRLGICCRGTAMRRLRCGVTRVFEMWCKEAGIHTIADLRGHDGRSRSVPRIMAQAVCGNAARPGDGTVSHRQRGGKRRSETVLSRLS